MREIDQYRRKIMLSGVAAGGLLASSTIAKELTFFQRMWLDTDNTKLRPVSRSFEDSKLCVATDAAVDGPYYADKYLERSDIRDGKNGALLDLRLKIVDATACKPLGSTVVEIWHCDALGRYSRYSAIDPNVWLTPGTSVTQSDSEQFLRGRQQTDANGMVSFRTIYPGWYTPRTPHIHGKIWMSKQRAFSFQMYFPDKLNREVLLYSPYSKRPPTPYLNMNDIVIARSGGGNGSFLKMSRAGTGFKGSLTIGVPVNT